MRAIAIAGVIVVGCASRSSAPPPRIFDGVTPERAALAFARCPKVERDYDVIECWSGWRLATVRFVDRSVESIKIDGESLDEVRALFDRVIAPILRPQDAKELRDTIDRPLRPEPPADIDQHALQVVLSAEAWAGIDRDDFVDLEWLHRNPDSSPLAGRRLEQEVAQHPESAEQLREIAAQLQHTTRLYDVFARRDRGYVGAIDVSDNGVMALVEWRTYPRPHWESSR